VTRFSARTSWNSEESSYAAAVREGRANGQPLWDLTVSNPTRCGFDYDAEKLLAPLSNLQALIYDPDPRGMIEARKAVATYYAERGAVVSPEHLLLTTSTSESYSYIFSLLCDPGDEVLIAQPSYPLFDFLADLDDVRLRPYPLFYDHGWWIDMAAVEAAISPRTRAIIVVHPNNPTGNWVRVAERHALEALCVKRGIALIVDEVFLDYPLAPHATARSFACDEHPALTFVLSGMSKIAGLPQMKAAWIATLGPDAVRREALARLEIIADTFLSMNAPVQLALPAWLAATATMSSQILDRARTNFALLQNVAAESPERLHALDAEAGWSAVIGLPGCAGEADCAERLFRERGVVVHPGSFYGIAQSNRVVVSLICPMKDFSEGIYRAIG
jgi:alanine-synthesizing transaminase